MSRGFFAAAVGVAAVAACAPVDEPQEPVDAASDVASDRADTAEVGLREVGAHDGGRFVADVGPNNPDGGRFVADVGPNNPDGGRFVADVGPNNPDGGRFVADVGPNNPDGGRPDAGPPTAPEFGAIPWSAPGFGVAYRDSENPRGDDVFIGYAGYAVQAPWAQAWVTQLFLDALRDRGVRHVYAVQGPRDAGYDAREIGNTRLIAHLLPRLAPGARILVAAHSSGAFVAHEMLGQLYLRGLDPERRTAGRVSYWDLDGGSSGLSAALVGQLRHAWFVWANDATIATRSPNAAVMISAGATYASAGGALALAVDGSGCNRGAAWCVHMTPITTRPHDPARASVALDYGAFDATHRVQTAWLTRTSFGAP